jgi:16S rRNA processing protein RimM
VTEDDQALPFGRLGRPHGVRGEIALHPFNVADGLPDLALPLKIVLSTGKSRRELTMVGARPANDVLLVRLEGIDTRDQAATLTNGEVLLPRAALPELDDDQVYVKDLVGCTLVDVQGRVRGTVASTFWNGAQDVLTVTGPDGELLVPAVPEFILEVDLDARRIVADLHE